jgi:hypothetical protein
MITGKAGMIEIDMSLRKEALHFQLSCLKSDVSEKHYKTMSDMIESSDEEQMGLVSKMISEQIKLKIKWQ